MAVVPVVVVAQAPGAHTPAHRSISGQQGLWLAQDSGGWNSLAAHGLLDGHLGGGVAGLQQGGQV